VRGEHALSREFSLGPATFRGLKRLELVTSWLRNIVPLSVLQYALESIVVQQETGRAADIVTVPTEALAFAFGDKTARGVVQELGLQPTVPIPDAEGLKDVFFASMSGRVVPFDEGSFARWRLQREARRESPEANFADQLVTREVVPVAGSIHGTSLTTLFSQGGAWTVSVVEGITHDPLRGLAVLVVAEAGITVAQLAGAARSTAVIWLKYRMRQRLGIPLDWVPPEDRR